MSAFDVEGLIELVKQHVYLYDITHRKYKDANLKATIWESIAQKLNRNSDAVRHKWKTIRDGYIKYKKQLKQSEDSNRKVIEYVWSSQLSFLDNFNVNRRNNTHINYTLQPQVQLFEESNGSRTSSPTTPQWPAEDEPPSKRKKNLEQGDIDQILSCISTTRTKNYDAIDHLFMSYAETFKRFSPRRQAQMKIELAQLFSKAELQELQSTDNLPPGSSTSPTDFLYTIKAENIGE